MITAKADIIMLRFVFEKKLSPYIDASSAGF